MEDGGWRGHAAIGAITPLPGAEQQHGGEPDPAAHGMHHDGAGEVMEGCTEEALDERLHPEVAVPDHALEEGIEQPDDQQGGEQLGVKARALGDTARDDGRDRGGKGQEKEELDQGVAVLRPGAPRRRRRN